MTKPSDNGKEEERLLTELVENWARLDDTFRVEPTPLPDWTALVSERRRLAKRKLWRELAILWSAAVPLFGLMLLLATGLQPLFWLLQAAAGATGISLLVTELRSISRYRRGGASR